MATQIQIMSDLHLESPSSSYEHFKITPTAPYLALLGDIGNTKTPGLLTFLTKQLSNFKLVFILLGNHEPYHSSWDSSRRTLQTFQKESQTKYENGLSRGRFIFLDQTRFDVSPEITILGCTLNSKILVGQEACIGYCLNDFHQIKDWTVSKHNEAFASDLAWLNAQVSLISREEPERKFIIFTHHGPTIDERVVDPEVSGSDLSSAFLTDLRDEECWKNAKVKVWAFGHTHFNCDFVDVGEGGRKLRVLTNQRGYCFKQAKGFEEGKTISL